MLALNQLKLVLGSKSPRRQELLAGLGIPFTLKTKETDESYDAKMPQKDVPVYLASIKAKALSDELLSDELLITSDTIVLLNDVILGKPKDRSEAIEMLQQLMGKQHEVITGVCLQQNRLQHTFAVSTTVFFKQLSLEEIEYYVDTFKPYDKAGSYGIQEWIGYVGIDRIEGSYYNVMGLPLAELYSELKKFIA